MGNAGGSWGIGDGRVERREGEGKGRRFKTREGLEREGGGGESEMRKERSGENERRDEEERGKSTK